MAATMRSVIASVPMPNDVWTRADDPVELGQQVVVVVGAAVGADVRLGADEDRRSPRGARRARGPRSIWRRSSSGVDVVAEAVRGRVVGDRDVLEARGRAPRAPSPRSCCARRRASVCMCRSPRRSACSISAGTSPALVKRSSPRSSRSSGGIHGEPEERVDLLLGRAAVRLAGRVVEDAVLGDVQPAADGRLAQRHVVGLRAGEVLQQVAELVGLDDAQVDRACRCACAPAPRSRSVPDALLDERRARRARRAAPAGRRRSR